MDCFLIHNYLTSDPDDQVAVPANVHSCTLEVRTHFVNASTPGQQLRKAQFPKVLNI